MLLDTLNALSQAGIAALQSICELDASSREVLLVREGRRSFPSLVTMRVKGCPLQMVHMGCDDQLAVRLAEMSRNSDAGSGLDVLAESFLSFLLKNFDDRNPRGTVEDKEAAPATLHTRGVRTFQFQLDTGQGQLYLLAEVSSRAEMAIARDSDFMTSMESIYLPADWQGGKGLTEFEEVDNFLTFLRKTEGDIYLEAPAGDGTATLSTGLLLEMCQVEDRPVLKILTDFSDRSREVAPPGTEVKASVGVDDRFLEFALTYLGPALQELSSGPQLPCALFSLPESVTIGQRRRTFRVSITETVRVEMEPISDSRDDSPGSDSEADSELITGLLADLSFSGARIISDHPQLCSRFNRDNRVVCRMYFPDRDEPHQVLGVIRRSTVGPSGGSQWQDEIGLEFLVSPDDDRSGLEFLRQFVLGVQRAKLAQRLQVTGS